MFYLFHSPGERPTVWLNFDSNIINVRVPEKEDGWFLQSSASSHVPHKQYRLQRYHLETGPVTVSTQVQPQEQAGSLRRYHPEPVPVTDSEQVSQKQPESLHHASRVTGTVETFPRFVHLSVLWLVINTAVLVLCMWKNERQSGYQMLSFSAGCSHLLYYSIFYA